MPSLPRPRLLLLLRLLGGTAAAASGLLAAGCTLVERAGVSLLYREAALPAAQVHRDICYVSRPENPQKQSLDFYQPAGRGWPVMIFIHGGAWTEGDKGLRVGGADVYGNIGRFYAARGTGVAVISYRLLPETNWRGQVADAAAAAVWVRHHVAAMGGDAERIFLCGHSAGAQIAAQVALQPWVLAGHPDVRRSLRGVIAVSGAGFAMADARTYALGHDPHFYEGLFRLSPGDVFWQENASPVSAVRPGAPPFLILHGGGETAPMIRQSECLHEALDQARVPNRLVVVPRKHHAPMVLTLSRPDQTAGPAILDFLRTAK